MNEEIANRLRHCKTLPSLPAIAIRVIELANDPDASMVQLSDLVSLDPALSAKLIKVAGSALFQSRRTPSNVRQAIGLLGTHAAIMIVLSFSVASTFKQQHGSSGNDTTIFWRRSILSALACRALGEKLGMKTLDDLFLAGLLQDIGILAYDTMMPDEYGPVFASTADHDALLAAERATFDCGHDEVGYWLLKRWGLPDHLALACLASHSQSAAEDTTATIPACVAASGYVADSFLRPLNSGSAVRAVEQVQERLGLDASALAEILDTIGAGMHAVEELFDVTILRPPEITAILAEARELLVLHDLGKVRELEERSHRDALTGAHNRGFFDQALRREFDLATRHGWPLTVAMIDIDHFKAVNDTFGHPAGDSILISMVQAVQTQIRQDDVFARYGGEEFALLFPGTALEATENLLLRLKHAIASLALRHDDTRTIRVTVSIGVVAHMNNAVRFDSPESLIEAVDQTLYAAKHAGRNRIMEWGGLELATGKIAASV